MSTAKSSGSAGKEQRRARRRRRKVAAATGMLLVAAAVAGEPVGVGSAVAGGAGGGLHGLVDPDSVSADGDVGDADRIGDEILDNAGDVDKLRRLGPTGDLPNGPLMIPSDLYKAYRNAATILATEIPSCRIHWSLLASIGRIESNHAQGGQVDNAGNTVPHILGPELNGGGFAAIRDTDGGRLDGDARWDRAVGAMQFIPSTWQSYAADGNKDGVSSPHNIYDATVAAGRYLCSGGMDLSDPKDRARAVFRYNHSDSYVTTVLIWADAYAKGTHPLPSTPVDPAQLAAMRPQVSGHPGGHKPAPKPGTSTSSSARPPASDTRPPSSSSRPSTTTTSVPPSCGTPTSTTTTTTTTTTPPSSPPTSTTPTPSCPPSSTPPSSTPPSSSPPSSSAPQGSSSVTPTESTAPSSSAPAGEAGTSVVPSS